MLGFLAGLPGQLATLTTRLSSTWAAKLDTVASFVTQAVAPAATALSTAQWTNARAGNLDSTNGYIGKSRSQTFTADGTWTRPVGVSAVRVYVQGGGGGGGGAGSGSGGHVAATGGRGASGELVVAEVTVSGNVTVTIGAAGTGGAQGVNGTAGGTTTFAADLSISAEGGAFGSAGVSYNTPGTSGTWANIQSLLAIPSRTVGAVWSFITKFVSNTGDASFWSNGPAAGNNATAGSGCGGAAGQPNGINSPGQPGYNGGSGRVVVFWTE